MDREHATRQLNCLFAQALEEERGYLGIYTLPDKQARFFKEVPAAVEHATSKADTQNVYFTLGLQRCIPEHGRGKASDICCITCLWAEIDIACEFYKNKAGLPPSTEKAFGVLDTLGLAPSLVVHSGHGIQVYWLLREPWAFANQEEQVDAERLCARWSDTVQAAARGQGYNIDSVRDLSRLFRVAGTTNRKGAPVPVRIIEEHPDRTYNPDSFEELLVEVAPSSAPSGSWNDVTIVLNVNASPPFDKFNALCENNWHFKRSWNHTRRDLPDSTLSGYDQSLASIAKKTGWTDQEVCDLLTAHRRQFSPDAIKRLDYYQRTIFTAKQNLTQETLPDLPVDADKDSILKKLQAILKLPIIAWVQHGTESANYSLTLDNGKSIVVGDATIVLSASSFRSRLYDSGVVIPMPKKENWDKVCQLLAKVRIVIENPESSLARRWAAYIADYLSKTAIYAEQKWPEALHFSLPFAKNGSISLNSEHLRDWIVTAHKIHPPHSELWEGLRQLEFKPEQVAVRVGKKILNRRYWTCAASGIRQELGIVVDEGLFIDQTSG